MGLLLIRHGGDLLQLLVLGAQQNSDSRLACWSAAVTRVLKLTLEEVNTLAVQHSTADFRSILAAKEVGDSLQLRGRLMSALRCIGDTSRIDRLSQEVGTQPDLQIGCTWSGRNS